ncbi:cytochrome P450 [Candidatus Poribacteria bacterium]|nr:cytochrome P450 [Candidatus Poribacteria bacterium]
MATRKTPPGPRGHFLFGSALDYQRNPLETILKTREQYGDVARYRMLWIPLYQISHPEGVEQILQTHRRKYHKGIFQQKFKLLGGEGLLSSEDDFWLRQRKLAQPAFHRKRLDALGGLMTQATTLLADQWKVHLHTEKELDLAEQMTRLTLQIVAQALLGVDFSGEENDIIRRNLIIAAKHVEYRMNHPFSLPESVPTRRNRRFKRALGELDRIVYRLIADRRREGVDTGDLLSMLMLATDEETGDQMDDRHARDEVMTILLAGHETSAMGVTWALYELNRHPDMEQKLHAEVDTVLGGRLPTVEDLPHLTYTRMVIDETLRRYPPAWGIARQTIEDDEIGGYRIPKGVQVMIATYATHHHPDFWEQPEVFAPERFTPECAERRPRFAYYPFSGGPRICIGKNFALMEMHLILATLAQRYRLSLVSGHPVEIQPLVSLRPRHGMRMTVHER